jgi:hypothetical protein
LRLRLTFGLRNLGRLRRQVYVRDGSKPCANPGEIDDGRGIRFLHGAALSRLVPQRRRLAALRMRDERLDDGLALPDRQPAPYRSEDLAGKPHIWVPHRHPVSHAGK